VRLTVETIGLREANQDFSGLVDRVARTGRGVLVTRRGVPVVRILPVEGGEGALTDRQKALLDRLLGDKLPMVPWRFDRDELYDD
jgi:prevent-host-death family protein